MKSDFQCSERKLKVAIAKANKVLDPSGNKNAITADELQSAADELQKTMESVVSAGLSKSHPLVAKARGEIDTAKIMKSQCEFDKLLRPYSKDSDICRDDIDDELVDAHERMEKLREKGRHETKEGSALQKKITDLKNLMELRQLVVGHPRLA